MKRTRQERVQAIEVKRPTPPRPTSIDVCPAIEDTGLDPRVEQAIRLLLDKGRGLARG